MIMRHVTLLPPDAIFWGSKCTQNAFAAAWGAYSAPRPDPLAVFEGAVSRQGRRGNGKEGRGGKGEGGEGKGREGKWTLATL